MTGKEFLDILNSATTFGILTAIAVLLMLLVNKKYKKK